MACSVMSGQSCQRTATLISADRHVLVYARNAASTKARVVLMLGRELWLLDSRLMMLSVAFAKQTGFVRRLRPLPWY